MELAVTTTGASVLKSGWPSTTSAGWPFTVGNEFQMRIRLLAVSATATIFPSEATAKGRFIPVWETAVPDPVKSVCPSTTLACPTHTGHRELSGTTSVGCGKLDETLLNISTRLLMG